MPTTTQTISVSSTVRYEATGSDQQGVVVTNLGPDLCYYAAASTVSSGSNDGSLASGAQLAFTPSKFFISAGTSRLQVVTTDQFRQYDRDMGLPGLIAPVTPLKSVANLLITANTAYLARFVPSRPMTITKIAFVTAIIANNDDACDVGIYDAAFNRLVSKGSTTGLLNATGLKVPTITATTLQAGQVYFAAFAGAAAGTAATLRGASITAVDLASMFGSGTNGFVDVFSLATSFPLPATIVGPGIPTSVPLLAVREV